MISDLLSLHERKKSENKSEISYISFLHRFTTQEQCERECGEFRDQDVCNMEKDRGKCIGRFQKWYFDKNGGKCKSFTFGGCEGNGNRFSSQEECESVCFLMEEVPSLEGSDIEDSKLAICKLEVDEGPCDETLQRWYFDIKSSTCRPFIFGGCAGNRYVYTESLNSEEKYLSKVLTSHYASTK